jgi:small subunit ribosomal protein S18
LARKKGPAGGGYRPARKKRQVKLDYVDYKDYNTLRQFISDRGKIRARRVTGLSTKQQREVAVAIKRAREMALLPYVVGR